MLVIAAGLFRGEPDRATTLEGVHSGFGQIPLIILTARRAVTGDFDHGEVRPAPAHQTGRLRRVVGDTGDGQPSVTGVRKHQFQPSDEQRMVVDDHDLHRSRHLHLPTWHTRPEPCRMTDIPFTAAVPDDLAEPRHELVSPLAAVTALIGTLTDDDPTLTGERRAASPSSPTGRPVT
jgi:hypothetical protein